jgi:hypothetical protein
MQSTLALPQPVALAEKWRSFADKLPLDLCDQGGKCAALPDGHAGSDTESDLGSKERNLL